MSEQAIVREVGLRDGLQLVRTILPRADKIEWCRRQAAAGFKEIEVTSFVPPSVIPQFADAAETLAGARQIDGLLATVLVPNLKGAMLALDGQARKITFVLSASEEHNLANVRRTTDQSIEIFRSVVAERANRGLQNDVTLVGVIATSFGCSIQGDVPEDRVFEVADQLLEAGADELNIADTVGYANPAQVLRIVSEICRRAGPLPVAAHFHDTRGMGLANVVAALEGGIRRFDASLAGLGGCPFAPGASGNIATEDCVYLLENLGMRTGIDLDRLLEVRRKLEQWLPHERLEGRLLRAGPARTFRPIPSGQPIIREMEKTS